MHFNLAAFLSVVLIATFTPGPNNILSMSRAAQIGFRKSFRLNLGMFAGFIVIMLLCTVFNVYLFQVLPAIKPVIQVIGAGYMIWLAWMVYRSDNRITAERQGSSSFLTGLLLQFINPKVILFGVTIIATFVMPNFSAPLTRVGFALFLAFVGFVSTCCWAIFGTLFKRMYEKHQLLINTILAVLLLLSAVSLFL
jgi:threonine/homoserine/homoserine lactone efflux protein